jgi:hypothetical protein
LFRPKSKRIYGNVGRSAVILDPIERAGGASAESVVQGYMRERTQGVSWRNFKKADGTRSFEGFVNLFKTAETVSEGDALAGTIKTAAVAADSVHVLVDSAGASVGVGAHGRGGVIVADDESMQMVGASGHVNFRGDSHSHSHAESGAGAGAGAGGGVSSAMRRSKPFSTRNARINSTVDVIQTHPTPGAGVGAGHGHENAFGHGPGQAPGLARSDSVASVRTSPERAMSVSTTGQEETPMQRKLIAMWDCIKVR